MFKVKTIDPGFRPVVITITEQNDLRDLVNVINYTAYAANKNRDSDMETVAIAMVNALRFPTTKLTGAATALNENPRRLTASG